MLPYPDSNFVHQMTNSLAKMSRKSGTPEMIAFLNVYVLILQNLYQYRQISNTV